MKTRHGVAAAALLALAGLSPGAGTILMNGATVAAGTSPSPGAVVVDATAPGAPPSLPSPGTPGAAPAMTGSMPAFPGAGNGGDGALAVSADLALSGGTYNYSSLSITNLATLSFDGPVTLLVQGDVTIYGFVATSADSAPVTIRCGGNFSLLSESGATPSVATSGASSPIFIAAAKGVSVGSGLASGNARVSAQSGNIDLQANGTVVGARGISIASGEVLAPGGGITVKSAAEITVGSNTSSVIGNVYADGGPALVQSFGASLLVAIYGEIDAQDGQAHTLESAGSLTFDGYTYGAGGSPVTLTAVAGPLNFGGSGGSGGGGMTLRSGGSITVAGDDQEIFGFGGTPVTLEATGGDVTFDGPDSRIDASGVAVTVTASGSIHLFKNYSVMGKTVTLLAQGGDVEMWNTSELHGYGALVVRASDRVAIGIPPTAGLAARGPRYLVTAGEDVVVEGKSVEITAGDGGVLLDAATANASTTTFTVLSLGPVAVARSVTARGAIDIASLNGDVDVEQATLTTADDSEVDTGPVTVETWLPTGTVAADGATIRSGNTAAASGEVSLLVHAVGIGPVAIESFVLPKKIKVKLDAADDGRSSLVAAGFLDTGPDADPALAAAATVTLGGMEIPVDGLVPDASGTKFTYKGAGLQFQVKASRIGSSKATFRVKYQGGLAGQVDPEQDVALSFDNGTVDGTGVVGLQAGGYVLGHRRGALVAPNLYLYKAKVGLKGDGQDTLSLKAGLATGGTTPEAASSVTVGFGGSFSRTVPAGSFVRNGERYEFHGDEGGITLVILDYLKETVTVKGKGLDLGTFAEGAVPVVVTVGIGGDARAVRVRMGRKGSSLVY